MNFVPIRALGCLLLFGASAFSQNPEPFSLEEATITQVHDAMKAGRLTCRTLVDR